MTNKYSEWCILIKFGKKEHLEMLQKGQIYMNTLQFYRKYESSSGDEVVGDASEAILAVELDNVKIIDNETNEIVLEIPISKAKIDPGYSRFPVFCLFRFDKRNEVSRGEHYAVLEFTEEQKNKLVEFGEYALVIKDSDEFDKRLEEALSKANLFFAKGAIEYRNPNNEDVLERFAEGGPAVAFIKREKYGYQSEFRYMVKKEVENHLKLQIEDISDISEIVPIKTLLNMRGILGFKETNID
ncbi:hypothetical protein [Abiotrophia defectiva]